MSSSKNSKGSKAPLKGFISYCRDDRDACEELRRFLAPLGRVYGITFWTDHDLRAGEKWDDRIREEIATARIFLLLCSQHWLSSDYIQEAEVPAIQDRIQSGEGDVIAVILVPCPWDDELGEFQAVPVDKTGRILPIRNWHRRHDAFNAAANQIKSTIIHRHNPERLPTNWLSVLNNGSFQASVGMLGVLAVLGGMLHASLVSPEVRSEIALKELVPFVRQQEMEWGKAEPIQMAEIQRRIQEEKLLLNRTEYPGARSAPDDPPAMVILPDETLASQPPPSLPLDSPPLLMPEHKLSASEVIVRIQTRMREVGCYSGAIDGVYGPRSDAGLALARVRLGLARTTDMASVQKELELFSARPGKTQLCAPPPPIAAVATPNQPPDLPGPAVSSPPP